MQYPSVVCTGRDPETCNPLAGCRNIPDPVIRQFLFSRPSRSSPQSPVPGKDKAPRAITPEYSQSHLILGAKQGCAWLVLEWEANVARKGKGREGYTKCSQNLMPCRQWLKNGPRTDLTAVSGLKPHLVHQDRQWRQISETICSVTLCFLMLMCLTWPYCFIISRGTAWQVINICIKSVFIFDSSKNPGSYVILVPLFGELEIQTG